MRKIKDLVKLLLKVASTDGVFNTSEPRVSVIKSSAPTAPELVLYEPTLCVVAQGVKEAKLDNQHFLYDASNYLLGSLNLPVLGSVVDASEAEPFLCLRLKFSPVLISEILEQYHENKTNFKAVSGLTLGEMNAELIDTVTRFAEILQRKSEVNLLLPLIERELIIRLLEQEGVAEALRLMTNNTSRFQGIKKAVNWLEENYSESVLVSDLAKMAGMSLSSFYQHFNTLTGCSPIGFRNRLRLMAARKFMLIDGLSAAEAGFLTGFNEPSQFSREYSRQYGVSPKRDCKATLAAHNP